MRKKKQDERFYQTFSLGDSPALADRLLSLILDGKKTATVSVILRWEKTPKIGNLSLVLDGKGDPACVIKTVHVEVRKFRDMTWDLVKEEGEAETFEEWQSENRAYWTRDGKTRGYVFTDDTPIYFERFEVVEVLKRER